MFQASLMFIQINGKTYIEVDPTTVISVDIYDGGQKVILDFPDPKPQKKEGPKLIEKVSKDCEHPRLQGIKAYWGDESFKCFDCNEWV